MRDGSRSIADIWELIASSVPDEPAVACGDELITWQQFDREADALGDFLLGRGLGSQAKVGEYLYNSVEYLEAMYGCFKAGLVPVNTNYRYVPEELARLWINADIEAVFFHGSFCNQIESIRSGLERIQLWVWVDDGSGPCPHWAVPYEALMAESTGMCAEVERGGDDPFILYTGGTTGAPKGTVWGQHDLFWYLNGAAVDPFPPGASDAQITQAVRNGARPAYLVSCPLMHGTGSFTALRALGQGGSVILIQSRSFDVAAVLEAVERRRAHTLVIVGDAFGRPILDALEQWPGRWDISSLEEIMSSGVMWSEENKRGLLRHNESMRLVDSLASSEALGIGRSTMTMEQSVPTSFFELSSNALIVDDQRRIVPPAPGASGRLAVRRSIPLGYYNDEVKTRETFFEVDGERLSVPGDFAMYGADGQVQLLGRGSQCINTGGEKVFPEEVEEVLKTHQRVSDAAVVGVPDDRFGHAVIAVVALGPGTVPTSTELIDHVKLRLASYKAPRKVVFVDSIPRTPSGKLDYGAIEKRLRTAAVPGLSVRA
jgi:3-oxocholest-4-en-26-oate---CoA ligase